MKDFNKKVNFNEDEVNTWLKERWKDQVCDMCKTKDCMWSGARDLYQVESINLKNRSLDKTRAVPFTIFTCNNCGNTKFVNAFIAGADKSIKSKIIKFFKKKRL
jgi:RNase P subunit RPR2